MAVQIGAKPDSGFDDPIGMLVDCHRRIERFLQMLCIVVNRAQGKALTEEEVSAVQSALQYFRAGGRRHTADEEESLFPRLRTGPAAGSFEQLADLENDHRQADDLHRSVETLCSIWIADGSLGPEDTQRLQSHTDQLKHIYEQHIQLEEQIVFPRAGAILDSRTIAQIGQEFQARRK